MDNKIKIAIKFIRGNMDIIEKWNTGKNIFLTGGGGTGKSFLTNKLKDYLDKEKKISFITATTGAATLQYESAQTIHRFSGIGIYNNIKDLDKIVNTKRFRTTTGPIIYETEALIIDEISMLRSDVLELLDVVFKYAKDSDEPFGGIQTMFVGDFCLKDGTEILMYNGNLRKIEDVSVNELVMGPDSKPRKVLRTFKGESEIYKVSQKNAEDYYVTPNHKIRLKRRGEPGRYPKFGRYAEVKAKDMVGKSRKFKTIFGGYKAGLIDFKDKELLIDPYFLGLWLGDGEKGWTRISTPEPEIIEYLKKMANSLDMKFSLSDEFHSKICYRASISKRPYHRRNKITEILRYYNVFNNKHIPNDFLVNSEEKRLKLLAGLLDTDGCWSGNRYVFSAKEQKFAKQVKNLCDHLGFRTNLRNIKGSGYSNNSEAWEVTIGGDTWRIPCLVKRKKSYPRNLGRCRLSSTVDVNYDHYGKFSGIEVDQDNLFLLSDGTVLHNCQLAPVVKKEDKIDNPWAFQSHIWDALDFETINLTKIHRQSDETFINVLKNIRVGKCDNWIENYFKETEKRELPEKPVRLVATNKETDIINIRELNNIDGDIDRFKADVYGDEYALNKLIKECPAPEVLDLKPGATVIILKNGESYVNGSMGKYIKSGITEVYDPEEKVMANTPCLEIELFSGKVVDVPIHTFEKKKEVIDDVFDEENMTYKKEKIEIVEASMTQFPVRLGYAITTHRSQGMSLDYVEIDFLKFFTEGQAYVALSRAKNYEGLKCKNFNKYVVNANKDAFNFYMDLVNQGKI